MKSISIFIALVLTFKVFAGQVILECTDLGDGNLVKIQLVNDENGKILLNEFLDDDSMKSRKVKEKEMAKKVFKLSSYYGYSRELIQNADSSWNIAWTCGESFPVTCVEAP